jgi:hypothetical protein
MKLSSGCKPMSKVGTARLGKFRGKSGAYRRDLKRQTHPTSKPDFITTPMQFPMPSY